MPRFCIELDGYTEDRETDDEFPNIRSVAETEQEAVDIWVILYNANLLTSKHRRLTNESFDTLYVTYVKIETFDELKEYMRGVHTVNLKLTQY